MNDSDSKRGDDVRVAPRHHHWLGANRGMGGEVEYWHENGTLTDYVNGIRVGTIEEWARLKETYLKLRGMKKKNKKII